MTKNKEDKEKTKVLLVDDNKDFCQLLEEYLEEKDDMEVVGTAYNGNDALNLLKEQKQNPDILILDLIMPHLDGIGVMEEMKNMGINNEIKTIILTAFGHEDVTQRVISLGADYYIMKPFDLDKLVKRIRQMISPPSGSTSGYVISDTNNNNRVEEEKNLSMIVTEVLHELGIPAHIKGYLYLRDAIELVIEDVDFLGAVTKELYPEVAENFNTTSSRVERAIRHAIEVAWNRGNTEALTGYFSNNDITEKDDKPTNSQFIAKIADQLRLKLRAG